MPKKGWVIKSWEHYDILGFDVWVMEMDCGHRIHVRKGRTRKPPKRFWCYQCKIEAKKLAEKSKEAVT